VLKISASSKKFLIRKLIFFKYLANLINYWPMSNLSDVVGEADLFGGSSYSFTCDRFGSQNSAIYFNKGYLQVPNGVYFSGDFTFTAWIYLKSYQSWSKIFDFGNGRMNNNVYLGMSGTSSNMMAVIYNGSSYANGMLDTLPIISLNRWYFISFISNSRTGYVFVNGNQVKTGTLNVPNNIIRTSNFIGYGNWGDPFADAIFDELKIYQGAISSNEIMNEYQLNYNKGIINFCPSNYWRMSNLSDVVGGANLFGGSSYSFVPDRFCSPNSAIYFNKGYLQVPNGVYFSGDFTVTAWIYLKSYQSWSRIFDFGNGKQSDNIYLSMIGTTSNMEACIYNGSSYANGILDTLPIISLNQWYFISFISNSRTGYVFVNGNQVKTGTLNVPNNIIRTSNFIGKNNWADNLFADAIYDEFKIYQRALSSVEIMNEYKINSNNGK
jgi:hypothetical protein